MKKWIAMLLAALLLGSAALAEVPSGVEDGVLTVAMECAYAPYNWAQPTIPTARCRSRTSPACTPTAMT